MALNVKDLNTSANEGSIILLGLSCFNNYSDNGSSETIINTVSKGCERFVRNKGVIVGDESAQRVDAVAYVVVVLTIYTSAMLFLLIKYMRREENQNHGSLIDYYRRFYGREDSIVAPLPPSIEMGDPQLENKERLKETQRVLQKLYGCKWIYLYSVQPPSQQADLNTQTDREQENCSATSNYLNKEGGGGHSVIVHVVNGKGHCHSTNSCLNSSSDAFVECESLDGRTGEEVDSLSGYYCGSVDDASRHERSADGQSVWSESGEHSETEIVTELTRCDSGFLSQSESCHSVQSCEEIDETA